jgi:hypothetical protein
MGPAGFLGNLCDYLMPAQLCSGGQGFGLADYLLPFFAGKSAKVFCPVHELRVLMEKFVNGGLQEAEAFSSIGENIFPGDQPALSPAMDSFGCNADRGSEFFYGIELLSLLRRRLRKTAAESGNEYPEVFGQLITLYYHGLRQRLWVKTGDAEAHKIEGVFLVLFDNCQKLLGGIKLFLSVLVRREPELDQQLCQVLILYGAHTLLVPGGQGPKGGPASLEFFQSNQVSIVPYSAQKNSALSAVFVNCVRVF